MIQWYERGVKKQHLCDGNILIPYSAKILTYLTVDLLRYRLKQSRAGGARLCRACFFGFRLVGVLPDQRINQSSTHPRDGSPAFTLFIEATTLMRAPIAARFVCKILAL